jgi:hypothetical protein
MDLWGEREIILKVPIKNVERKEINTQMNIIIISIMFLQDEATATVGRNMRRMLLAKHKQENMQL